MFRGHSELGAEVVKENFVAYIILSMHGCLQWRYMTKLPLKSLLSDNCLPRLSQTRYGMGFDATSLEKPSESNKGGSRSRSTARLHPP